MAQIQIKKGIYKHCIANSDMSAIMRVYVYMYFLDFFLIYKHSSSCMHVLVTSWNNLFSIFIFSCLDRRQWEKRPNCLKMKKTHLESKKMSFKGLLGLYLVLVVWLSSEWYVLNALSYYKQALFEIINLFYIQMNRISIASVIMENLQYFIIL